MPIWTLPWLSLKRGRKHVGYSGKHKVLGLKRSLVIDSTGNPLAIICLKANYHDQQSTLTTIDLIKTKKPEKIIGDTEETR